MRQRKLIDKAFIAIEQGATRRVGASIARLPLAIFQNRWNNREIVTQPRRTSLTEAEEQTVVSLLIRFANHGYPLYRDDLCDAVELLVSSMPIARQQALPFVNNRPGRNFLRGFEARHKSQVKIGKDRPQEEKRWRATNVNVLTTHLAEIEALIKEHSIDSSRMCNLDESVCSPETRNTGMSRKASYSTPAFTGQMRAAQFSNVKRVTVMPVCFASGRMGNPLFVVEGCTLKWRVIDKENRWDTESLPDCLPDGSYITTRRDIAGVDRHNFLRCKAVCD